MANDIKITIKGDKEIIAKFKTLPARVQKKGMRKAQSKAATPIMASWKQRAAKDTGVYRRSIKRKQKTYASGKIVTLIGPDRGVTGTKNGKLTRPANYSHLVEKGHGGPKPAPPHKAAEPAYRENVEKSKDIMNQSLWETIRDEAKK